jgi:DNA repair protein SbcC/Rad50
VQLRRLRVRNIRSYEAGEIGFPPGTTLIAGDVGSGKTSLLYAVEMALFGVAEVDAAYLVRHGASHAEVEVEFEDSEHRYTVRRRFRRVRRKGRETFEPEKIGFTVDGGETTYSATELRQRVIELLGFPDNPNPQAHSDLWRWAVYVPQERMRDILGAQPQDRLETVRKALGVERFRTAADNAQELGTDLRRSAKGRRAEAERLRHFDAEFAEWTAEADRLHVERARLTETIARRDVDAAAARASVTEAESAVRRTEADRRVLESLRQESEADRETLAERARVRGERLEEIARRNAEAEAARAEAGALGARRARVVEAEAARSARRTEVDRHAELLRALSEARAQLTGALQREADAQRALERGRRDCDEARQQLEAARREGPTREPPAPTPRGLADIDRALTATRDEESQTLRALTQAQAALSELGELLRAGVCPRCHQSVRAAEFAPHREEAAETVRTAEAAHQRALDERSGLEDERRARERFERAFERWTEVEKRRAWAEQTLRKSETALRAAEEAAKEATSGRSVIQERVAELEPEERVEQELRAALAEAERTLGERSEEAERSAQASEVIRSAHEALTTLAAEVERLDREAEAVERRALARNVRMAELERAVADAGARRQVREAAEARLRDAEDVLNRERGILVRADARLDEAARRVRAAERGRADRSELLKEADDLEVKAAWVSGPFRTSVLTMEQKLLAHAQATFEREFARYFGSLVDDPGLVARTDVAFTPAVTIEGEWTPAEALSGGERTSLALAFRLALARVVRSMGSLRLDTMLLDEPTDGFSPEQVVRMGELLEELALPQVIIVSHEGQLAAIADRVVRVYKQDGRSVLSGPPAPDLGEERPTARSRSGLTAKANVARTGGRTPS